MNTSYTNPYVGPRTFLKNEGHLFFGRDREARDLFSLVNSEQLVLFYAQSGAGKSSLINTRLIPNLEAKNYEVLRVGRVGGQDYPGIDIENIYVFNLLRSLTQREVQPEILAKLHLDKFLSGLQLKKDGDEHEYFYDDALSTNQAKLPQRRVLIIDQFEEIFSTHPEAWSKRGDFFDQVAQAMENDRYLWVVLVMREDYIAALDPYAHLVSGGLRTRYYMQRLSREAAIKAVRKPVENMRPYEAGVAEKLVEDLSSIKVQKPDGTLDFQPGQYVEPVQLQVVCYSLWESLPNEGTSITEEDLREVGDVNEALGKYYAGRVAGVAEAKKVKERLIRDWIERKLIAPGGIRSMVLQETNKKSGEISDDVIQALQSDLVRAENRGGAMWFELTHDRLVGPILSNNKKWFDENLSPLQRQAALWNDQERNERWLLRDQALTEVDDWAKANPDELTELEKEFLEASHKQQEAQSAKTLRRTVAVVGSLALIAVLAAVLAFWFGLQATGARDISEKNLNLVSTEKANTENEKNRANVARATAEASQATAQASEKVAKEQANIALSGNLVAQADSIKNSNYTLALLLGMEAYQRNDNLLTRTTLFQLLQFTPYKRAFGFAGPVSSVAVSPDGTVIGVASCRGDNTKQCTKGTIKLYDTDMKEIPGLSLFNHELGPVYALAFSRDGKTLAAGGCVPAGCAANQGQITFWNVSNPKNPEFISDTSELSTNTGYIHTNLVKTVAFSPDGNWLASGSYDTTIIMWDIRDLSKPSFSARLKRHFSFVNDLAFSPDGKTLVSASDDQHIWLWNAALKNGDANEAPSGHTAPINSIVFSQDGTKFASAADDNTVLLWNWDAKQGRLQENPMNLKGHTGYVKSVAFNDNGTILASAGFDNRIILWDARTGQQIGQPLNVHSGAVNSIVFGTQNLDGKPWPYLISGSDDYTVVRWDLSARLSASQPLSQSVQTVPEESKDRGKLKDKLLRAVANEDRTVTLSDVTDISKSDTFLKLEGFSGAVAEPYFSQDGKYLYTVEKTGESERITQWEIDPEDWIKDMACTAVKQNLTLSTKKTFLDIVPTQSVLDICDIKLAVLP